MGVEVSVCARFVCSSLTRARVFVSHPLDVTVNVAIPRQDTDKWRLDGSTLSFSLRLTASVDTIKQEVEHAIGLPSKLQKLKSAQRGVLKDGKSLASYNFEDGETLELEVPKRGGRK